MEKVSIMIPAYNEEKRIRKRLDACSDYFENLRKKGLLDYELFVIINNTKDKTEEIVKECQKKNKRIVYINLIKGGKGYAVVEGFKDALKRKNDIIGFVDADMATSPEECYKLIANIGNSGGIIASRYIKGSSIYPKPSIQRLIAKRMFNTLARTILFLPHRDTQCGAKFFRRGAISKIIPKMSMSAWAFDVEILYLMKKEGFRVKEFPTVWVDQDYSTINFWQAGPGMALSIVRLRVLNSPFRDLMRVYDFFKGLIKK